MEQVVLAPQRRTGQSSAGKGQFMSRNWNSGNTWNYERDFVSRLNCVEVEPCKSQLHQYWDLLDTGKDLSVAVRHRGGLIPNENTKQFEYTNVPLRPPKHVDVFPSLYRWCGEIAGQLPARFPPGYALVQDLKKRSLTEKNQASYAGNEKKLTITYFLVKFIQNWDF